MRLLAAAVKRRAVRPHPRQHRAARGQDAAVRLQDQRSADVDAGIVAAKVEPGAAVKVKRGVRCAAGEPPVDRQLVVAVRRLVIAQGQQLAVRLDSPLPPGGRPGSSACRRRPGSRRACRWADNVRCGRHRGSNCGRSRRSCRPACRATASPCSCTPKPVASLPSPSKPPSPLLPSSSAPFGLQAGHGKVGRGELPFHRLPAPACRRAAARYRGTVS